MKTSKEKSEELIIKFLEKIPFPDIKVYVNWEKEMYNKAKNCALICIDEILFTIQDLECENVNWDYWQEVKQEIEKYEF